MAQNVKFVLLTVPFFYVKNFVYITLIGGIKINLTIRLIIIIVFIKSPIHLPLNAFKTIVKQKVNIKRSYYLFYNYCVLR